ncbi:hypothetical protein RHGRI_012494 [Rhododendron griersonianum]|uniref:Uncharacterized protein n=1 Tax=Rhododendron griersonianum TaxID=479676 RepID=A0AAV6KS29_9ERIC|nr:hypothetical protein RHGRI_012494 [Rhododendron griersonianum]
MRSSNCLFGSLKIDSKLVDHVRFAISNSVPLTSWSSQILDVAVSLAKVADGNEDAAADEFQEAMKL